MSTPSISVQGKIAPLLQQAAAAHQAKQWETAANYYQEILSLQPQHADSLHLLGLVHAEQGQALAALELLNQAVQAQPGNALFHCNRGLLSQRQGQWSAAIRDYQYAISLAPERSETYIALADTYALAGQYQEAIIQYLYACYLNPHQPPATHHQLGNALLASGNLQAATVAYQKALTLKPDSAETLSNLGVVYAEMGLLDKAIHAHQQALAVNPNYGDGYLNLGLAFSQQGAFAEADEAYQHALQLSRNNQASTIHNHMALNQKAQGQWENALTHFDQALTLDPHNARAQFNRGLLLLLLGRYREGWNDYEARQHFDHPNRPFLHTPQPLWQGEELQCRTLLVHAEQGLGDTLQFVRYLPLLKKQGAILIVQVQAALINFLKAQPQLGVSHWLTPQDALPFFDYHVPLLSLPQRLQTELTTIPEAPYLKIDSSNPSALPKTNKRFRVGLVWAGNPQNKQDRERSLPLALFAPLLAMKDIAFYSLQYGDHSRDIAQLGWQDRLIDLSPELSHWQASAILVSELDLVITVDTAVAHLCGALGKPAWVLLAAQPDFRWLLDGSDNPWYPSLQLFRQSQPRQWEPVLQTVAHALQMRFNSKILPAESTRLHGI